VFGLGELEFGYWFFVVGDWFKGKSISPQRRRERRGKAKRKELLLPEILRDCMEREGFRTI
jgi:hypothetical protein